MIDPDDLILVSVDDHICEPRDMFDAHVPAKDRDQAPRVVEEDDGVEHWFRDHMLCCFISEDVGIELINRFNIDHVCWEPDYPHSDTDWPNAAEAVARVMAPLSDVQVAKITHENAMRHHHFDPSATRPKEQCTARALRAEWPDVDTVTHVGRPATERDAQIFKHALRGIKVPAGDK